MRDRNIDRDHIRRMYGEACDRLADAQILSRSIDKRSDSDSILRVLALEVLLKAVLFASGARPLCLLEPKGSLRQYDLAAQSCAPQK